MNRMPNILAVLLIVLMISVWLGPASAAEPMPAKIDLAKIQVLDLETATRIATAENPTLAEAQARVVQARQVLNQARAAYWPQVDFNASRTQVDQSNTAYDSQAALYRAFGQSVTDPQDYYRAGLSAKWLLFDGFARKFNVAAARHSAQSAEAGQEDARRLLLQAVTNAFLSAQLSLENIAIAKADEAFNQRQLTEAKLRYEVGTGALSDKLNFEVKVNTAQADLIEAERAYQTDRIALAALLGVANARLPESTRLAPLEAVTPERLESPHIDLLMDDALNQRPDLKRNEQTVLQADADSRAKKANYYYPSISLTASYDGERNDGFGFESDDFGNTVGIVLSYNIFAGGLYKARYQQAKARLYEVEKTRDNAKITIFSEIETTVQRVLSAQKQLLLSRTNAKLVQKNRDLVEKEYKAGVGSLVRLNEAQRDLTAAQVRLALAQTTVHRAWYDLWSATGQILTKFTP